ncbi:hypothetical protein SynPROS71_02349 [Synechococcus sp. PROS-7-1]|nr:hypothetical protein SynPROS71_02349 [Synechococcus sp. PROS-7-1]
MRGRCSGFPDHRSEALRRKCKMFYWPGQMQFTVLWLPKRPLPIGALTTSAVLTRVF